MKKLFTLAMALLIPMTETIAFAQCGGGAGFFSRMRERRASRAEARASSSGGIAMFGSGCSGGFAGSGCSGGFASSANTFGSGCSGGSGMTMTPVTVECPTCPSGFATVMRPVTTIPQPVVSAPIPKAAVTELMASMPADIAIPIGSQKICDPVTGKCYIIGKIETDAADELVAIINQNNATQELVAAINQDPLQELIAAMDATNELIASSPILLAQR